MPPPFPKSEYEDRLTRVRKSMKQNGMEALLIGDPSNINWLTGYDAWSFYTPQVMLLSLSDGPYWIGREMDAGAANYTTYLPTSQIIPYPETLVQTPEQHPANYMARWIQNAGFADCIIGYESDSYFTSPKLIESLKAGLPKVAWLDADLLVNWVRLVKSEPELEMMRQAGKIAQIAMHTAYEGARIGVRQSDLMAEVVAAQIRGTEDYGGDIPALHPLILAGESASTAHPMWTDEKLGDDQTVAFELGGCRKRYNVGLARTIHLGKKKPTKLIETGEVVKEGMSAVKDSLFANVKTGDIHKVWQKILDRYGLEKKSRIGYSIGVGYSPDWGEHTISFRAKETTVIPENATVHIILGMWMDGWGMELSETLHVRKRDCIALSTFSWDIPLLT